MTDSTPTPTPKPKLIVDEDWKSKVQAEKESAKHSGDEQPAAASPAADFADRVPENVAEQLAEQVAESEVEPAPAAASTRAETLDDLPGDLPRATFSTLVTMLATQAMVALGQFADPAQNKPVVRLNFARHYIDTLSVLETKTQGQLTREEAGLLEHVLHDLRMAFVEAKKHHPPHA